MHGDWGSGLSSFFIVLLPNWAQHKAYTQGEGLAYQAGQQANTLYTHLCDCAHIFFIWPCPRDVIKFENQVNSLDWPRLHDTTGPPALTYCSSKQGMLNRPYMASPATSTSHSTPISINQSLHGHASDVISNHSS